MVQTFEFIEAVSDTVFDTINTAFRNKPFNIYWGYVSGAVRLLSSGREADSCLPMFNADGSNYIEESYCICSCSGGW